MRRVPPSCSGSPTRHCDERTHEFQRPLREHGFAGPAAPADDGITPYHWPRTCDIKDWTIDGVAELRARFEATVGESTPRDHDMVLFHDGSRLDRAV